MGVVYRAYHAQLERSGAVKVLQGIAVGPDAVARFHHEAQAIAQMRHPNIVNVFDFGEYQGTPYMIVEYVPGGNLAGKLQQTPLDKETTLKYLRGIAAGLDYAHSMGIVHRDVKPGNVLLEKDGTPVLADFGLVKLLQGSSIQSMTGVTTGTPAYMAPEQVMGHQVGPPADRYSLATMAYEMLTGSIPFEGEGVLELLYAHVHRDPVPPSSRNPALSASVDAVIMRGLAKNPDARWESCAAFVNALSAALDEAPGAGAERTVVLQRPQTATKPLSPVRRTREATPAATAVVATPAAVDNEPRPSRSRRRLIEIVAGAAILLLLLVGAGICAASLQGPKQTLALDPSIVVPGQTVLLIATRVPANQIGEVRLQSQLYTYQFEANGNGDIRMQFDVPLDIGLGDHHVRLCWNSSCPLEHPLRVVAPGSLPNTTPSPSPSATPAGSPNPTSSPTKSAKPGTSPTSAPTSGQSPIPAPAPKPTPKPSAKPTPPPTPAAYITLGSVSAAPLGNTTMTFHYFYAGSATVYVYQNGTAHPAGGIVVSVTPGSSTPVTFKTPAGIVPTVPLVAGQAYVKACTSPSSCLTSNSVNVL